MYIMVKLESVHGGHNNNAVGARGLGYKEEVLANELAKMVADRLTGCRFISQDGGDTNQNLAYFVREMDKKRGVNLSIHFNAFPDPNAHGTECYSYKNDKVGQPLAVKMSADVAKVLGTTNRGQKTAPLYVIDRSIDTTLLLEVGFITNKADMDAYIKNKDGVADAIAMCFDNYKGASKPTVKPTPPKPQAPSKPKPSKPQTKIPKGFTAEKAKFTVTTPDGIQVRKGSYGLKATKAGILKKGQSINYDSWASKDGYIWVHYTGNSGDELFLPVRPVGKNAWGTFK